MRSIVVAPSGVRPLITSADQALEIYQIVLPHTAAVDARRWELVSKIVDERVRNRP